VRPTLEDIVDVDDSGWREMSYVGGSQRLVCDAGCIPPFLHVKVREGPIDLNDPGYFLIPERK
jgi:hypothetical protein